MVSCTAEHNPYGVVGFLPLEKAILGIFASACGGTETPERLNRHILMSVCIALMYAKFLY